MFRFPTIFDINWFFSMWNGSYSLSDLIEYELLSFTTVHFGLENQLLVSNNLYYSVHWHFRYYIEWSINMETEISIQARGPFSWLLVKVEDIPFLTSFSTYCLYTYILFFNAFATFNINSFIVLDIYQTRALIPKYLEPAWVCVPHLHILRWTSIFDVKW